jgi:hypothetical protein
MWERAEGAPLLLRYARADDPLGGLREPLALLPLRSALTPPHIFPHHNIPLHTVAWSHEGHPSIGRVAPTENSEMGDRPPRRRLSLDVPAARPPNFSGSEPCESSAKGNTI